MVRRVPVVSLIVVLAVLVSFSIPLFYLVLVSFVSPESYYGGLFRVTLSNTRVVITPVFVRSVLVSFVTASAGSILSLAVTFPQPTGSSSTTPTVRTLCPGRRVFCSVFFCFCSYSMGESCLSTW